MKAKITKSNGTVVELEDCTSADLVALLGVDWNLGVVSVPSCWPVGGCLHEYPSPWHGLVPPNCKKCGVPGTTLTVSSP